MPDSGGSFVNTPTLTRFQAETSSNANAGEALRTVDLIGGATRRMPWRSTWHPPTALELLLIRLDALLRHTFIRWNKDDRARRMAQAVMAHRADQQPAQAHV